MYIKLSHRCPLPKEHLLAGFTFGKRYSVVDRRATDITVIDDSGKEVVVSRTQLRNHFGGVVVQEQDK